MMRGILNKLKGNEKGQAFILALILLAVGGLIIAPLLAFMGTGLMASQVYEKNMQALYTADAGVEDALWRIMNDPPASLPDSYQVSDVNGMSVDVLIEEVTLLYGVDVGEGGIHDYYLQLDSELIDFVDSDGDGIGVYTYRLRLTNTTNSPVKIHSITIGTSVDLSYLSGLDDEDVAGLGSGSFNDGILTITPAGGNQLLTWDFSPPRPDIEAAPDPDNEIYTTVSCTFQLVGPENAPGITAYLVLSRSDVGIVWENKPYKITAAADDGGTVITTVLAGVLESSDAVILGSWQIE
jgi:hypothetical protein